MCTDDCDETEKTICESCDNEYCDDCCLEMCEWCEHMRTQQIDCPNCEFMIDEFNQTICWTCFYLGILLEDITYCLTCETFIIDEDDVHLLHDIEIDEETLLRRVLDRCDDKNNPLIIDAKFNINLQYN